MLVCLFYSCDGDDDTDCCIAGDQVSRRGALTGGYVDNRKSRLEIYSTKQELHQQLATKEKEFSNNKEELVKLEVYLNSCYYTN